MALAYDSGRIQRADDLPAPLLWPQPQVSDEEIADTTAAFNLTDSRPDVGFCPTRSSAPPNAGRTIAAATLAQRLIENGHRDRAVRLGERPRGRRIDSAPRCRKTPAIFCLNTRRKTQLEQAVIRIAACRAVVSNDSV
ncbi:hypothetical protein M8494_31925 [Serratia ureilytica]